MLFSCLKIAKETHSTEVAKISNLIVFRESSQSLPHGLDPNCAIFRAVSSFGASKTS